MGAGKSIDTIPEVLDFMAEVEEERINQGLTMFQFSEKIWGYGPAYYSRGRGNMTATSMKKIADGLGKKLVICLVDKEDEDA